MSLTSPLLCLSAQALISYFSRLVTCEADKSIKVWKENPLSTEDSDPIDMDTWTRECLQLKRY